MDFNRSLYVKLKTGAVYRWLNSQHGYISAVSTFKRYPEFKKSNYQNALIMQLSGAAALGYAHYNNLITKSNYLKVATPDRKKAAYQNCKELLRHINAGVVLQDFQENDQLIKLLEKLKSDIKNNTPNRYATSYKGDLPAKELVRVLHQLTRPILGKKMTTVIYNLCSVVSNVSKRTVQRHLKEF